MIWKFLFATVFGLAAATAYAESCPTSIRYANGRYLKYGSVYYHENGKHLLSGSNIYYESGEYLKFASNFYYPGGSYISFGNTLYYPDGSYLKFATHYYYPSGDYLKFHSNFYHPNGQYARLGNRLYRSDGTQTPFPITLRAPIGSYGELVATVRSDSEDVYVDLYNLPIGASAQLSYLSIEDRYISMYIYTGYPGEAVRVSVYGNTVSCELVGTTP